MQPENAAMEQPGITEHGDESPTLAGTSDEEEVYDEAVHCDQQEGRPDSPDWRGLRHEVVQFQSRYPPGTCPWACLSAESRHTRVVGAIEKLLCAQTRAGLSGTELAFVYPNPSSWTNVCYHPGYGLVPNYNYPSMVHCRLARRASARKYSLILLTLAQILELFDTGDFATKRELFYGHVSDYGSASALDACVNAISAMLGVPRIQLRILSTAQGLFMGHLAFRNAQGLEVCGAQPTPVPQDVWAIVDLRSEAEFILVVEKDATFQRLADENFAVTAPPCIVLTGKGVPDHSTRQFLHLLWTRLQLPVLALVDCDPFGLEIMFNYKFGSLALSWCQTVPTAVPTLKWLGPFPSDLAEGRWPEDRSLSLAESDCAKIRSLRQRPYLLAHSDIRDQIDIMRQSGLKAEIEAVASPSEYVLHQIINQQWLG